MSMELIIEEHGKVFAKVHQARLADLKRLLKTHSSREDAESLLALADDLMVYSHSQALLKRSGPELLEWLQAFLEFLRQRDEDVNVAYFVPPNSGSSFLLVNAPEVPYLVDSLKTILQHLPQRAMVISHPILNINRKDGVLTGIGERFADGQLESFIIVQFEGVRDLDTASVEDEIRRVFQVAETVGRQRKDLNQSLQKLALLDESQDQKDFTEWLLSGNFICFGHASVEVLNLNGKTAKFKLLEEPLGWLPDTIIAQVDGPKGTPEFTKRAKKILTRKNPLIVEILQEISPIYQQDNLIYLGFRECCKSDRRVKHIYVRLFSQNSVNELASNVLPLKTKLLAALNRQHVPSESYDYRKVVEIFNTFPKVEMFFLSNQALDRLVQSFVSLQRQQSVKLVVTRSLRLRGVTLFVIMPSHS